MQEVSEQEFINSLKAGQINPYQVYDLDLEYTTIFGTNHYLNHPDDNILKEQKLNILFFDIEVFTNNAGEFPAPNIAKYPIISNTIYSTFTKTYEAFYNLIGQNINLFPFNNIKSLEEDFKKKLIENGYLDEDENIKINYCQTEEELIRNSWDRIHELDVSVLSGFNADQFDLPYIYNRLSKLYNNDKKIVHNTLSKFGSVKVRNYNRSQIINIADYPLADIRHLYVPRSEGGANYGKTLASYSLDFISDTELKLKKFEYKKSGMSIDDFYLKDPINYLLYNIIDVILVNKLNQKLQHIELHNMLRRIMCVPFHASLRGSSVLFDGFVYHKLRSSNQHVRFGIVDEKKIAISKEEIKKLPVPKVPLVKKYTISEISKEDFVKFTSKFPGAYVKDTPVKKIFDHRDGVIADLDATSLYPSMIRQQNISFNTFYGLILDPNCYRFFELLIDCKDNNKKLPSAIYKQIADFCKVYVRRAKFQNMNDAIQITYYIIVYLMKKILECPYPLRDILSNNEPKKYIIFKTYLIPLLNLISEISDQYKEYNTFVYNYLINQQYNSDYIYIIENYNSPKIRLNKILSNEIDRYLKEKNVCLSLSGALFYTHEKEIGLFSDFLKMMKMKRDEYKTKRNTFTPGSEDYNKFDKMQLAVKILMNTTYGLFGLSSYRYSNKELAKAITIQGRLTLKISQIVGETVLNYLEQHV